MTPEPLEMSYASQLLAKIEASDTATIKELAYWSGLHENTVRDYRDGRIKHFGSETRFWNQVMNGLVHKHGGNLTDAVYQIAGLTLQSIPVAIFPVPRLIEIEKTTTGGACKRLGILARDLAEVADAIADIYDDGKVDRHDDPRIAEFNTKADALMSRIYGIKALIAKERAEAASGGKQ